MENHLKMVLIITVISDVIVMLLLAACRHTLPRWTRTRWSNARSSWGSSETNCWRWRNRHGPSSFRTSHMPSRSGRSRPRLPAPSWSRGRTRRHRRTARRRRTPKSWQCDGRSPTNCDEKCSIVSSLDHPQYHVERIYAVESIGDVRVEVEGRRSVSE